MNRGSTGPRLYLAGTSGAGKTSVARLLGEWLGVRSADVDAEVERRTGRTVAELWRSEGERAFRAAEREALAALLDDDGVAVLALGGGTLEDPASRDALSRWGAGLWLDAPPSTLAARIGSGSERPLLDGRETERALRALDAERRPRYAALPLRAVADGPTPEAVAVAALRALAAAEPGFAGGVDDLDGVVRIGRGALAGAGDALAGARALAGATAGAPSPLPVVTDARVWALHGRALAESLARGGREALPIALPEGEAAKATGPLETLWKALLEAEAARDTPLAVLGGGALGDVGGFAAATFKRGLPLALFPTTLLAQVDAAIGGKNGIDFAGVKNVIGAFHDPALVAIDPLCPLTQPARDWRAGWAEVVKSGLVGDAGLFDLCEREPAAIAERRLAVVEEAIRRAAAVKLRVVAADPREAGPRRALNLGHTLGHALEAAAEGALLHGEAVAIGLVAAARLAERERAAERGLADRVEAALEALALPVRPPAEIDPSRVLALVRQDKKRAGGRIQAVLPVRPGAFEIRALDDATVQDWVREALAPALARAGGAA